MTPERIAEIRALGGPPNFYGHYSNEDGMGDSCPVFDGKPCGCSFSDVRKALDELLAEVERQEARYEHLSLRMEGVHNRLTELGAPCGTFCQEYADKRLAERAVIVANAERTRDSLLETWMLNSERIKPEDVSRFWLEMHALPKDQRKPFNVWWNEQQPKPE